MAKAALDNPDVWPQIRSHAISMFPEYEEKLSVDFQEALPMIQSTAGVYDQMTTKDQKTTEPKLQSRFNEKTGREEKGYFKGGEWIPSGGVKAEPLDKTKRMTAIQAREKKRRALTSLAGLDKTDAVTALLASQIPGLQIGAQMDDALKKRIKDAVNDEVAGYDAIISGNESGAPADPLKIR